MSRRRRGVMSEELRYELAEELGVADIVKREGFGGVSSRDCGNLVKLAIQRAEGTLKKQ
ncbi:MAG: small, acid-soluble spore protein, alpha/beta type [Firmicutes bacterium]|mgnify:CR=1 FL=1|nr:small, acid-soluble spore protein, alpha/beta type [Bacillota bacterium]